MRSCNSWREYASSLSVAGKHTGLIQETAMGGEAPAITSYLRHCVLTRVIEAANCSYFVRL